MKIQDKKLPLVKHCSIEIYRDGSFVGKGMFMKRAGTSTQGDKQCRIINERGMIEFIPTSQIVRIGGAA
ncbi:MAG: hypothetical protein V3V05_10920 [Pontiella sp.]